MDRSPGVAYHSSDSEEEDDSTRLTVNNNSGSSAPVTECEDPWKYPPPGRTQRNQMSIPGEGPCIPIPCLSQHRRVGKLIIGRESQTEHGGPSFDCVIPACWPMLIFTECLIGGVSLLCYCSFLPYLGWFWWLLSFVLLFYVCGSLFKTATTDPGIVPRVLIQPHANWRWSERAQSYHAPNVVFCQESNVLVADLDHFCPWTGTTIAGGNINWFYMFLSGIFIQMIYVMVLMFIGISAKTGFDRLHNSTSVHSGGG